MSEKGLLKNKKMLIDELSEEEKDAVLVEIGYTRKQLDSDLEHLKDWLKLQHHLPASRLTEGHTFLKNFLAGCKGSLEKAKLKLDAYYTFRSHSEVFECRDPLDPDYVNINRLIHYAPMPKMAKYTRVVVLQISDENQAKFEFLSFVRNILDGAELCLRYERNHGASFCIIFDGKGISASNHIARIKPLLLKDMIYYTMKTMPLRFSNIFFINAPSFLAVAVNNFFMPFLPKKIKSRIHISANGIEELSQYFDKSTLPRDYGGDLPSMKQLNDFWRVFKIERRDWYMNELSEKCDETKRIVTEDLTNPYFGVPGSLKKLVID